MPLLMRIGGGVPQASGLPAFTYTGVHTLHDDGDGNWRLNLLTSGTLRMEKTIVIDACLVGGGGAGGRPSSSASTGGKGGNGAYMAVTTVELLANTDYAIEIGAGGTAVTSGTSSRRAGNPTSAFGAAAAGAGTSDGAYAVAGGYDDVNAAAGFYEFREAETGRRYCGGGGRGSTGWGYPSGGAGGGAAGGSCTTKGSNALANTGAGGGGGGLNGTTPQSGGNGGSGIVVVRNHREVV